MWRQVSGSTLAQVMVSCLTAPSHYLTQCWLKSNDIHFRAISQEMRQPSISYVRLKITYIKFHLNFPGAMSQKVLRFRVHGNQHGQIITLDSPRGNLLIIWACFGHSFGCVGKYPTWFNPIRKRGDLKRSTLFHFVSLSRDTCRIFRSWRDAGFSFNCYLANIFKSEQNGQHFKRPFRNALFWRTIHNLIQIYRWVFRKVHSTNLRNQ